jgi:NADP-dependent 3-hydroxy acid dehydrogenase YdfG
LKNNNKIVLVTGGSSGIGEAIIKDFIELNYHVINADKYPPKSNEGASFIRCDVTQKAGIQDLFENVIENYGIPDILVLNAGMGLHEKLSEGDPEKWEEVFEVNVLGALRIIRAFVPQMLSKGSGDIFVISSISALKSYSYGGIYASSKAALSTIAKTLQEEVRGVLRVMILYLGIVNTAFFDRLSHQNISVKQLSLGAITAEQVANLIKCLHFLPNEIYVPELTVLPVQQAY